MRNQGSRLERIKTICMKPKAQDNQSGGRTQVSRKGLKAEARFKPLSDGKPYGLWRVLLPLGDWLVDWPTVQHWLARSRKPVGFSHPASKRQPEPASISAGKDARL